MDLNIHHIQSPAEIITTTLGVSKEYKQDCIKEIYKLGDSMNQTTSVKAIMSTYFIWNETEIFNPILNKILEIVNKIYPQKGNNRWDIENTWSAIYKKGNYTVPHCHLPYNISFCYYFQDTENTPLVFDESNFKIDPIDDMLILFPSYINHSVPKHTSDKDRIMLAGNLKINPKNK